MFVIKKHLRLLVHHDHGSTCVLQPNRVKLIPDQSYESLWVNTVSVIRLGDISSLWQKFKVFDYFLGAYSAFDKKIKPLWQISYANEQIFVVENGQILNTYSSHLVTLQTTYKNICRKIWY